MSLSTAATRQLSNAARSISRRSFSSSPMMAAVADVKKLGVVGAGQMVRFLLLGQT